MVVDYADIAHANFQIDLSYALTRGTHGVVKTWAKTALEGKEENCNGFAGRF